MADPTTDSYYMLLQEALQWESRPDRTGTGTQSAFFKNLSFDLRGETFPLLTGKKVHIPSVVHELLWFLSGSTNIEYLRNNGVRIWDSWADEDGELGPVYGNQWRRWPSAPDSPEIYVDQIAQVIRSLKETPHSRRHIVQAWNAGYLDRMALPPCHMMFQFYVTGDQHLECTVYQRSADIFLGLPFNIASYALLTHLVAQVTGLRAGRLNFTLGDAHLYANHVEQARVLIERWEQGLPPGPRLVLSPNIDDIDNIYYEDIQFEDYTPLGALPAPIAV